VAGYELQQVESNHPDVAVVLLAGELDLTNAEELAERLGELASIPRLVLDLNRVVFIDSAALHCLFRIARQRGPTGLALAVERTAPIATTLEIVDLGRVATITATSEDAQTTLKDQVGSPRPRVT
jgi:anti-anti-sigma factor